MDDDNNRFDRFDRAILDVLSREGRISVTDLATRIGLSKTPTQARLKRLLEDGTIRGFHAELDPAQLDMEHVAFTEVKLSDTTEPALAAFNDAVLAIPEVETAHLIAGPFDYLLKIRTRDIASYRHVLGEKVSALPHVASTSTYVSMQAVKEGLTPIVAE